MDWNSTDTVTCSFSGKKFCSIYFLNRIYFVKIILLKTETIMTANFNNLWRKGNRYSMTQKLIIFIITDINNVFQKKLEKKRSSSMDKIMNKLRSAQKRAQDMRSSMLANQSHQVTRTSHKAISFRGTCQMGSLSGCFTCHAF